MATYKQIQAEIKKRYGYSAVTGWIAHVKEHHGLTTRTAHNRIDPTKRVNPCPSKKWKDIEKVMRSFGMIKQPKKTPPLPQVKYHPQIQYSKGVPKKVVLKSTNDSPWYWLIQQSIRLGGNKEPAGWHWLILLHYILKFNVADIQKNLPDSHPLKSASLPTNATKSAYKPVINEFNLKMNITAGSKIRFFIMDFSNLIIKDPLLFSNFIFPIKVDFTHSEFSQVVLFNNTVFFGDADFSNVTFFADAEFSSTTFLGKTARFSGAVFERIANFSGANFQAYANFKKSKLKGRTSFQRAKFKFHAPRFYDATFNNEMTFLSMIPPKFRRAPDEKPMLIKAVWNFITKQKLMLINTIWLTTTEKKLIIIKNALDIRQKNKAKYKQRIQENQNSYENTSILLEKQGKYHDQHFFFREEMRCRRRLEGPFNFIVYGIYQLLANYGYGVGRALLGWLAHICFWAWMLSVFVFYEKLSPDKLYCSFLTSLSNAHSFFLSKGERLSSCNIEHTAPKDIMRAFDFIWAIETMFGAFFLFLLLLTLRVRFRLGSTTNNTTINLPSEK